MRLGPDRYPGRLGTGHGVGGVGLFQFGQVDGGDGVAVAVGDVG